MQFDMVSSLIYLFGNLFRLYTIHLLFGVFFHEETTPKLRFIRKVDYIIYYIINSAAFLYFAWPPSIILFTNIIGLSAISLTYAGKWKFRICTILLSLSIYTICEDLMYYLILLLEVEHILVVGIIASDLMCFMIVLLLKKSVKFNSQIDIPLFEWIAVIVIPILSLVISILVLDKCSDETAVAIGEISLVLFNVIVFFLIDRIQNVYQERLDIRLLKQQNQAYENQLQFLRESEERILALKHDLKNHFISLENLATRGESKEIKEYIDNLIFETNSIGNFAETGNSVIDGFLNIKLEKAKILGADISVKLTISDNIQIDDKDISIILGNILDNAVTALKNNNTENWISVIMRETPGKLYIQVENSYQGEITRVDNKFLSTKKNAIHHGIGLKNVQKVVDAYNGTMKIAYTKNTFSVSLILFL